MSRCAAHIVCTCVVPGRRGNEVRSSQWLSDKINPFGPTAILPFDLIATQLLDQSTTVVVPCCNVRRIARLPTGPRFRVFRMDEPSMPGAFPSDEVAQPVQRAPKKRFVGRRALEAQGMLKGDSSGTVEETTALVPSSKLHVYRTNHGRLMKKRHTPTASAESNPRINPRGCRYQRCDRSAPSKLLVRDTQDHSPHTNTQCQTCCLADA